MHILSLPLRVPVSKKKQFTLNLNQYRNTHYQTLNKAKAAFKSLVADKIKSLPVMEKASFVYVLYPRTRQELDVANVCSIVDKFFSDAMVELGRLPDDNYKFLPEVSFLFGRIDPHNPRVEVIVFPGSQHSMNQNKEPDPMQITLNEAEIAEAVKAYVKGQINLNSNQEITVDFTASRGPNGTTATLNVTTAAEAAAKPAAAAPKETPKEPLQEAPKAAPEETMKPEPLAQSISSGGERKDPAQPETAAESGQETAAGENKPSIFQIGS